MLTSDMCLAFENVMLPEQNDCCAWVTTNGLGLRGNEVEDIDYCGVTTFPEGAGGGGGGGGGGGRRPRVLQQQPGGGGGMGRRECCGATNNDCDNQDRPRGVAFDSVLRFMESESAWLETYAEAWKIGMENG